MKVCLRDKLWKVFKQNENVFMQQVAVFNQNETIFIGQIANGDLKKWNWVYGASCKQGLTNKLKKFKAEVDRYAYLEE